MKYLLIVLPACFQTDQRLANSVFISLTCYTSIRFVIPYRSLEDTKMQRNRFRIWFFNFVLTILLCSSLCACGQKGALILPPSDTTPMLVTPQSFPEPETDEPESERAPLGILPGSLPTLP